MTSKALIMAALRRQCVTGFIATGTDRMPAAFVVSMQFRIVMHALPRMKIYKPKKRKSPWKTINS